MKVSVGCLRESGCTWRICMALSLSVATWVVALYCKCADVETGLRGCGSGGRVRAPRSAPASELGRVGSARVSPGKADGLTPVLPGAGAQGVVALRTWS